MKDNLIIAWRTFVECLRRGATPFLMYMTCSMVALACLNIQNMTLQYFLVGLCILFGVVFNVDLAMSVGKKHYQMLLSGNIRRYNSIETLRNKDRKSYKYEMEYRWYKGIFIGLCICLPIIIVCFIYAIFGLEANEGGIGRLVLLMICGWAVIPLQYIDKFISIYWTLACCILPVVVTEVSYILGALKEKKDYEEREARMERVRKGEKEESNRSKRKRERENRKF